MAWLRFGEEFSDGIGDSEELASMLVQLDDRARPARQAPIRLGTLLNPEMPRVTVNFDA